MEFTPLAMVNDFCIAAAFLFVYSFKKGGGFSTFAFIVTAYYVFHMHKI